MYNLLQGTVGNVICVLWQPVGHGIASSNVGTAHTNLFLNVL